MSFDDSKFRIFKGEYDKVSYYENKLIDLTDTLKVVTWDLFSSMGAKQVECFIGYENEFCLRVWFRNQGDLDTAYNYMKLNNVYCSRHNVDGFFLSLI